MHLVGFTIEIYYDARPVVVPPLVWVEGWVQFCRGSW